MQKKKAKPKSKGGEPKGIFKSCHTIDPPESHFWEEMIRKYLKPLENNEKEKQRIQDELQELRNRIFLGFFIINAIFVTIVFVLTQVNKDQGTLQIKLPCREDGVSIEPISIAFTLTFGILLLIQFFGMLYHRFSTFAHIIVTNGSQPDLVLKKKPPKTESSRPSSSRLRKKISFQMAGEKVKLGIKVMNFASSGRFLQSITNNKIYTRKGFHKMREEIDEEIQKDLEPTDIDFETEAVDRIINIRKVINGEDISSANDLKLA